ncbi:hypothetical protein KKC17_02460 [Patescibacteria group bacterium]|nr:hypothetical protein [Patescibacteria group bacterium]
MKLIIVLGSLLAVISLVLTGYLIFVGPPAGEPVSGDSSLVYMEDGVQYINITAKGGYYPRSLLATANQPTVLRIKTNNTFDCSTALTIPKLNYQKFLSPSAVEEINLTATQAQGTLRGVCSMGMYSFAVKFD